MVLRALAVSCVAALVACSVAASPSDGEPNAQTGAALENGTPSALPLVLVEAGPHTTYALCTGAMVDSRTVVASAGHCAMPSNLNEAKVCDTRPNGICSAVVSYWDSAGALVLTLSTPIVFAHYADITKTRTPSGTQLVCAGASTTGSTEAPFQSASFLDDPNYWQVEPLGNADMKDVAGNLCFQGNAIAGFEENNGTKGGIFYDASGFAPVLMQRECGGRCGSLNYNGRIMNCGGCPTGQICGGYDVCVSP